MQADPCAASPATAVRGLAASSATDCAPDAQIALTCDDGGQVTRGESMECRVRKEPEDAPGTINVEGWSFSGALSDGTPYVNPDEEYADDTPKGMEWGGIMAISGEITVRARIDDGPVQTRTAAISVEGRDWSQQAVPYTVSKSSLVEYNSAVDGLDQVPDYPAADADLGRSVRKASATEPRGKLAYIESGPNAHLAYFTAVPVEAELRYFVHPEMEQRGAFYRQQRASAAAFDQSAICLQTRFATYVRLIVEHEGAEVSGRPMDPRSHNGLFLKLIQGQVPTAMEDIVLPSRDLQPFLSEVEARLKPIATSANAASDQPVDTNFRVPFGCNFNYVRGR